MPVEVKGGAHTPRAGMQLVNVYRLDAPAARERYVSHSFVYCCTPYFLVLSERFTIDKIITHEFISIQSAISRTFQRK